LVLSGLAGALGVFFETETGVYLLVTFFIYSGLQVGLAREQGRPTGRKGLLLPPAVFCGTVVITLLPLLLYASRGTLSSTAFWAGWVEALVKYGSQGLSALPIAELPDAPLACFLIMIALYLGAISHATLKCLHGNARQGEVLLAALASYGLAVLLVFIGRSHPFNLCHATPPFAILVTALMFRGYNTIPGRLRSSTLPYALTGGLALLLLAKPAFRDYPSLLASVFGDRPVGGLSLRLTPPDMCGLPPEYENFASEVHSIGTAIQLVAPDGKGVAIVDLNDTMLYSVANACPWSRYAFVFQMALTQQFIIDVRNDLVQRPPRIVVIRGQNAIRPPKWDFIWTPLYEAVTNRYALCQTVGPYEIWAQPHSALVHCQLAEAAQTKGQVAEAIAQYSEALRLEPDLPTALNNLAWIRAAHSEAKLRDGAEAVRLAERACRVTGYKQAVLVGTLAAAHAEAGRFDQAVAMAKEARALALAAGQNDLAEKDQQLLELFKARQPYHEPAAAPGAK
jgi:tetratricopeptide (TPR) repeat protein